MKSYLAQKQNLEIHMKYYQTQEEKGRVKVLFIVIRCITLLATVMLKLTLPQLCIVGHVTANNSRQLIQLMPNSLFMNRNE